MLGLWRSNALLVVLQKVRPKLKKDHSFATRRRSAMVPVTRYCLLSHPFSCSSSAPKLAACLTTGGCCDPGAGEGGGDGGCWCRSPAYALFTSRKTEERVRALLSASPVKPGDYPMELRAYPKGASMDWYDHLP